MKTHRRGAHRRAFDPKAALKILLLTAAAISLGWLSVRAATLEALVRRSPSTAAALAPNDPRVTFASLNIEFRTSRGVLTPAMLQRAVNGLQRAPLAHDPFFYAALDRLAKRDIRTALSLINEARRRNPRSRYARLIFLDLALRAGEIEQAASEIATVTRLIPEASRILVPELARYAADEETAPALINALRRDPKLRESVLEHLASNGADPKAVMRLAASGPAATSDGEAPAWQSRMLRSLVDKGEVGRAKALWASLARIPAAQANGTVYDGSFRGAVGAPPFNWEIRQTAAGVAEPTKAPALQIEYYGRADAELASQLLQLRPGRHVLSLAASGNAPSAGGNVAWTLTCLGSKAPMATLVIGNINYAPKRLALEFAVPSGCAAQWLRLVGTPAEFPAAHSITVANLQIRRVSAS